jgi:hypothetical protein
MRSCGRRLCQCRGVNSHALLTSHLPVRTCSIMYDRAVDAWSLLAAVLRQLPRPGGGRDMKASLFWSAHQRFFRQMLIASKAGRRAGRGRRRGVRGAAGRRSHGPHPHGCSSWPHLLAPPHGPSLFCPAGAPLRRAGARGARAWLLGCDRAAVHGWGGLGWGPTGTGRTGWGRRPALGHSILNPPPPSFPPGRRGQPGGGARGCGLGAGPRRRAGRGLRVRAPHGAAREDPGRLSRAGRGRERGTGGGEDRGRAAWKEREGGAAAPLRPCPAKPSPA